MAPLVTYRLMIEVDRDLLIRVGALGHQRFPRGRYVYVGSARRGLEARVRRHLAKLKRMRWHIDYLLSADGVRVIGVDRSARPECEVCRATGGAVPVPGFGASDCRAGCVSHLRQFPGSR